MRLAELMSVVVCLPKRKTVKTKGKKTYMKGKERTGPKTVARTALQRFIFCYFRYKK